MKIVNSHLAHSINEQGMIKPPNSFGYIHLAAEVERPRFFSSNSPAKKALLIELKSLCKEIKSRLPLIQRADLFDVFIVPPGTNEGLDLIDKKAYYEVHIASFDIVILIECETVKDATIVKDSKEFKKIENLLKQKSKYIQLLQKMLIESMKSVRIQMAFFCSIISIQKMRKPYWMFGNTQQDGGQQKLI